MMVVKTSSPETTPGAPKPMPSSLVPSSNPKTPIIVSAPQEARSSKYVSMSIGDLLKTRLRRAVIIYFKYKVEEKTMEVSVEITRSESYRQIYAIGAVGGHNPYDFRISFYNDSPKAFIEGGKRLHIMERKIETEVILSPLAAKELAEWLNVHIKEYEKTFGEIQKPGKVPEKERSSPLQGYM
jgi:hypothetical protein